MTLEKILYEDEYGAKLVLRKHLCRKDRVVLFTTMPVEIPKNLEIMIKEVFI